MNNRVNFSRRGQVVLKNEDKQEPTNQYEKTKLPIIRESELKQAQESLALLKMKMNTNAKNSHGISAKIQNGFPIENSAQYQNTVNFRENNNQNQRRIPIQTAPDLSKKGNFSEPTGYPTSTYNNKIGPSQDQFNVGNKNQGYHQASRTYQEIERNSSEENNFREKNRTSNDKRGYTQETDLMTKNTFGYGNQVGTKTKPVQQTSSNNASIGIKNNQMQDKLNARSDAMNYDDGSFQGKNVGNIQSKNVKQNDQINMRKPVSNYDYDDDQNYQQQKSKPIQSKTNTNYKDTGYDDQGRFENDGFQAKKQQYEMTSKGYDPKQNKNMLNDDISKQKNRQNYPNDEDSMQNNNRKNQNQYPQKNEPQKKLDELPIKTRFSNINAEYEDEGENEIEDIETYPCRAGCTRKFTLKALPRHEKICKKVFQSKRKVFDTTEQRYDEEVLEQIKKAQKNNKTKKDDKPKKEGKVAKWKLESAQLKMASRQARGVDVKNTEEAKLVKIMEKQDTINCPHCGRNFSEIAGNRHIPFCAEKSKASKSKPTNTNTTTLKQPLNAKNKK